MSRILYLCSYVVYLGCSGNNTFIAIKQMWATSLNQLLWRVSGGCLIYLLIQFNVLKCSFVLKRNFTRNIFSSFRWCRHSKINWKSGKNVLEKEKRKRERILLIYVLAQGILVLLLGGHEGLLQTSVDWANLTWNACFFSVHWPMSTISAQSS